MPDLTKTLVNNLDTDFKFEVVISSLIEQGCDPEFIEGLRKLFQGSYFYRDVLLKPYA